MMRTIRIAVVGVGVVWVCGGCVMFEASMGKVAYTGGVEREFAVQLVEKSKYNAVSDDPGRNYRKLELMTESCPAGECTWRVVAQRTISAKEKQSHDRASAFELGAIDGWTDATHERVWLVERSSGRVVATWDRRNGAVTGIDEARPVWAEGGEKLVVSSKCDRPGDRVGKMTERSAQTNSRTAANATH